MGKLEQGSTVNKDALCVNMEKTSLNVCRTVYDYPVSSNVSLSDFLVKKELIKL